MYEDQESFWFNQTYLSYQDKQYQTNSFMRVSHSISTKDFYNFSAVRLSLGITTDRQVRNSSLSYENSIDLYKTIKEIMNNETKYFDNNIQVDKRYRTDQLLIFKFQKASASNGERVVTISIYRNDSDFGDIIIPFQIFEVVAFIIKVFVENYFSINANLRRDFLLAESLKNSRNIAGSIRNIPNQILNVSNIQNIQEENIEIELSEVKENTPEDTISQLDKFIGGSELENIKDIEVPDLDKSIEFAEKYENTQEFKGDFVEKILLNDLHELERILELSTTSEQRNPFITIYNKFDNKEFPLLPDISEKDLKSVTYLSKLFYMTHFRNNIENGISIPVTFFDMKYKLKKDKVSPENLEMAFDLLLFIGYIREVRNKLESKIKDAITNKSIMYLGLRCFCDIFTLSFLDDVSNLSSTIISRFKTYNKRGVFNFYIKLLKDNGSDEVSEFDITSFVNQISEKVIGKTVFVDYLQDGLFKINDIRIPSENQFNLEQIINEIVPLEVKEKIGTLDENDFSGKTSEIVKLFETKKKEKIKKEKVSNLVRFIKGFENEIPEGLKDIIWSFVNKNENNNCKLEEINDYISELGENIVKALYVWNPENDIQVKQNFSYFCNKINEETMGKKEIIVTLNKSSSDNQESDLWYSGLNLE